MGKDSFFLIIIPTFLSAEYWLAHYVQVKRASRVTRLYAECAPQKWLHSACAQRISLVFRGKTSAGLPRWVLYHISIFYVNQTNRVQSKVNLQLMTRWYIEMTTNTLLYGKLGRHFCRFPRTKKRRWLV